MKADIIALDVDYVGSQDPAAQPIAADFAAISCFIQEQKRRRLLETTQQPTEKLQEASQAA